MSFKSPNEGFLTLLNRLFKVVIAKEVANQDKVSVLPTLKKTILVPKNFDKFNSESLTNTINPFYVRQKIMKC